MKDAADLVHALQDNLGWTELRLKEERSGQADELALMLLSTCQRLAQLLAGAVAIARRDACVTSPNLQGTTLVDLAHTVMRELSSRVRVTECDTSALIGFTVTVLHDPEITASVIHRIVDTCVGKTGNNTKWAVKVGLRGVNAAIAVSCAWRDAVANARTSQGSLGLSVDDRLFLADILEICSALLARQGAALGFEFDEAGGCEFAIVWPTRAGIDVDGQTAGTPVAIVHEAPTHSGAREVQENWSGTMAIQSDRFGIVEVEERDVIAFPQGIIGFADERSFVLIRTAKSNAVGWLQSVSNPSLALPVVSAHVLAPAYPDVDLESYAQAVGKDTLMDELAVIVVLNAQPGVPATVNLVAPILVNVTTRVGAQVILDSTRFTTREMFILPASPVNSAVPAIDASATSAAE